MKSPIKFLSMVSLAATTLAATGCYTEREVIREPSGTATTRTTVRETVVSDQPPVVAPTTAADAMIVDQPPSPRVETVGVAPSPGHVWVPGHWTREGDRWVWLSGRWEIRPTPTAVYVPGHWEAQGTGYVWREGYWR